MTQSSNGARFHFGFLDHRRKEALSDRPGPRRPPRHLRLCVHAVVAGAGVVRNRSGPFRIFNGARCDASNVSSRNNPRDVAPVHRKRWRSCCRRSSNTLCVSPSRRWRRSRPSCRIPRSRKCVAGSWTTSSPVPTCLESSRSRTNEQERERRKRVGWDGAVVHGDSQSKLGNTRTPESFVRRRP